MVLPIKYFILFNRYFIVKQIFHMNVSEQMSCDMKGGMLIYLCILHSKGRMLQRYLIAAFPSPSWTNTALSTFLHNKGSPAHGSSSLSPSEPSPTISHLSCAGDSRPGYSIPDGALQRQSAGGQSPPSSSWPLVFVAEILKASNYLCSPPQNSLLILCLHLFTVRL